MGIDLNNEQILTVYKCENWFRHSSQQVFEIAGAAGTGKAQPVFTQIPTPNGNKRLGDLKVGDYVFNKYGKPVQILGVYDQGYLNTYKVTLSDGRSTLCNDEHLWTVQYNNEIKTLTLREIINIMNNNDKFQNFYVPSNCTVEYSTKDYVISPYIATLYFNNIDDLKIYEYGDKYQRLEFIRGVIRHNNCFTTYINKSKITILCPKKDNINLIKNIIISLGFTVFSIKNNLYDTIFYGIEIFGDEDRLSVFSGNSSYLNFYDYDSNNNYIKIEKIEYLKCKTKMRCIYIDDPEHLYLTNEYIVTHNTTIVLYLIEQLGLRMDEVLFLAYQGKAACRMTMTGLPAKTIHSAIYKYEKELMKDSEGRFLRNEKGNIRKKGVFKKRDYIGGKDTIKLIVVDEAGMVNKEIAEDLKSFGIPIIVLGDLNQLPPVFGNPYFLTNPDVVLTKIMRQNEGNPIVYLSQQILAGNNLNIGIYGKSEVIPKSDLCENHFSKTDIVLSETNRLRWNINNYFREQLRQYKQLDYPHNGEKVICRKNNWKRSIDGGIFLTNGMSGYVDSIQKWTFNRKENTMVMDFRPDFTQSIFKDVKFNYEFMYTAPQSSLEETENSVDAINDYFHDRFEFGYAITTHMCLPLDTMIYTEDGIQELGDLHDYSGKVYNGSYWEKPLHFINNGYDNINKFIMENNIEYNVTDNHRCIVITSNGLEIKLGKNIKVGDAFLLRKNMNLYNNDNKYKFENNDYIYKNQDIRSLYYALPTEMSIELAEVIGMICADGTIYKNGIRYIKSSMGVVQHFADNIYKIFNYKCTVKKFNYEEAWYAEINSAVIHDFFYNIKGLRPNKKYVPKCIMMSSINYQCAFIRGLFEDAYVHLKNETFDTIAFTFKNHKMKNQLTSIFLNLGIRITFATRNKITQTGKISILYDLYIFKRGALIYRDKIGFISKEKNNRLSCIDSNYERELNSELGDILCKNWTGPHNNISLNIFNSKNHSLTDYTWNKLKPYIIKNKSLSDEIVQLIDDIISNYYICRVKSIERYFDKTACLEMPETHVFIQDGFLGGNSQGSQYGKVLYLNENIMRTKEDQKKLTYTAITRAIDSVTIVI